MPISRTLSRTLGIAAGVVAGALGLGVAALARRPLPRTSGTLRIPGLSAPAQVLRDRWGVPHIYAATDADLFMVQGYVHAQDRLWQMEFQRRLGHGRLSELVGALALDTDRFMRVLGFSRIVRQEVDLLDHHHRALLEAYARGVNSYIDQHRSKLPLEFTLLRITPEPWQIADTLVWSKVMALNLSSNWSQEILNARMVAALGAERAAQLIASYPDTHALVVPKGASYTTKTGDAALHLANGAAPYIRDGGGQGSNNWVVGGARSTTGMPLLANDPHLTIAMPSVWYEMHLVGGSYSVAGASFAGTPGIVIGHNQHIAWGVTNGMTDVQDLYIERVDPSDPGRYEYQGEWHAAELIEEVIKVKDRPEPHIEPVRVTRHGPIISPLVPDQPAGQAGEALALRWTALDPDPRIVTSILAINRAADWQSFRAALASWHVPAQNFVYADVDGHIGYALGGDIPIRAQGDGRLPVPGWSGEYEWSGMIPAAEMPYLLDPREGFAVTANNRIVGDSFPYPIVGEYLNGYRAMRIRQLIEQTPQHTSESFARIHGDQRSLPGLELAALAGRLPADSDLARAARDALASWDGTLSASSVAGSIYARLRDHIVDRAYAEVGDLFKLKSGIGAFAAFPSEDMLHRAAPAVFERCAANDNRWLPAGTTWDSILSAAWVATLAELREAYGDDINQWRYGRGHQLTIQHALGGVPGLGRLLNRGPFETGGDSDTVCMGNLPRAFPAQPYYVAPSYRQILDVADWNRSRSIHPTGQSGHPTAKHYADFVLPWLNIEYHPMPWDRERVEEATASRLTLTPG